VTKQDRELRSSKKFEPLQNHEQHPPR
jgi:hypothetical protein